MRGLYYLLCLFLINTIVYGQIGLKLGDQSGTKQPSAILDLSGTTNQGLLIPRVNLTGTTSYAPLTGTPQAGMLVYNLATAGTVPNNVTPGFYYHNGSVWVRTDGTTYSGSASITLNGSSFERAALAGDATAAANNNTVTVTGLQGRSVSSNAPTAGQALAWNGTTWAPTTLTAASQNIYNTDGSLTGNRVVTQGANTLGFLANSVNGFSVDGSTFSIDAANNRVGIGTVAPNSTLDVVGDIGLHGPINQTVSTFGLDLNPTQNVRFGRTTNDPNFSVYVMRGDGTANWNHKLTGVGDSHLSLVGNVGIGVVNPTHRMTVVGGVRSYQDGPYTQGYNGQGSYISWNDQTLAGGATLAYTHLVNHRGLGSPGGFIFSRTSGDGTSQLELMRMRGDDGFVGIGVSNPTQRLQVAGNVSFSGALMPGNAAGTSGQVLVSGGAGVAPTWVNQNTLGTNNIYNADGTLTGGRTVTQGANSLTFTGAGALLKRSGAAGTPTTILLGRTATEAEVGVAGVNDNGFPGVTPGDAWFKTNLSTGNLYLGTQSATNMYFYSSNARRVTLTASGDLGIGTDLPDVRLDVVGAIRAGQSGAAQDGFPTQGSYLVWNSTTQAGLSAQGMTGFVNHKGTGPGGFIWSLTAGSGATVTEVMRINPSGHLGIGESNPIDRLHVRGNGRFETTSGGIFSQINGGMFEVNAQNTNSNAIVDLHASSDATQSDYSSRIIRTSGVNGNLDFFNQGSGVINLVTSNSARLTVTSSGNVGIGTATPAERLHVVGNSEVTGRLDVGTGIPATNIVLAAAGSIFTNGTGTGNSSGTYMVWNNGTVQSGSGFGMTGFVNHRGSGIGGFSFVRTADNTNFDQLMRIRGDGAVGIGIVQPSFKLHVDGNVGATAYSTTSDARLKKNVLPLSHSLDKVLKLQGVTFDWNPDFHPNLHFDTKNHIGFIAQEVEKIIPQVVTTADDEKGTKSVAYSDIVPVLVEAIKDLKKLIDEQAKSLEATRKELELLKSNR